MMHGTPMPTMVGFLHALEKHDETAALWTLAKIPTLIVCGDHDLVTPAEYSRKMAAALPESELVIVAGRAIWRCWTSRPPSTTGWSGWSGAQVREDAPCWASGCANGSGAVADGSVAWRPAAPGVAAVAIATGHRDAAKVEDTIALGSRLGRQLRAGDVVVLSGPLGAGKTVLAKGIAAAMDVDGPVTSPSYVLARVHPPRRAGAPAMIHVDVYRLLDHSGADLLGELDHWTWTPISTTPSSWWSGARAWPNGSSERHLDVRLERVSRLRCADRDLAVELP